MSKKQKKGAKRTVGAKSRRDKKDLRDDQERRDRNTDALAPVIKEARGRQKVAGTRLRKFAKDAQDEQERRLKRTAKQIIIEAIERAEAMDPQRHKFAERLLRVKPLTRDELKEELQRLMHLQNAAEQRVSITEEVVAYYQGMIGAVMKEMEDLALKAIRSGEGDGSEKLLATIEAGGKTERKRTSKKKL